MNRTEKQETVEAYKGMFSNSGSVVVCHYKGMTMKGMNAFRAKLRAEGGHTTVTKNTLAKLASKGTDYEGLKDFFTGPTCIVYSQDPITAAKVAYNYAKEDEKLVIVGGGLGAKVLDKAEVEALAKLPSLDEIRGTLVGLLQAPATKVARVLQAPAQQLVGVTKAYSEKG